MPTDFNDEVFDADKLLAELESKPSEESNIPKKDKKDTKKPEWADKKDDEYNSYEYREKAEEDDTLW